MPKSEGRERLKRKIYEEELRKLQVELCHLQDWIKLSRERVIVVLEGRDAAGKGGTIRAITERVSPRVFRTVALPAPSDREKSQAYLQRYIERFPAGGEIVIFDRSWYNRAGVEPVLGYCTPAETEQFLRMVPAVEKAMVDSGIILIKYWLNVSVDEQARRLGRRIDDPRKVWKLSPTDLKSFRHRYDYERARDVMLAATDTAWAPWFVAHNYVKKNGRLNIISHLLAHIPYEHVPRPEVKMPPTPGAKGYVEPDMVVHRVPEKY
jgi:polyphosphate kinase